MDEIRRVAALLLVGAGALAAAQARLGEYAIVLSEPPVARRVASRGELQLASANVHRRRIRSSQRALRAELASRRVRVTGSAETLVNAIFVRATAERAAELRSLAGVGHVEFLPPIKRHLDRAVGLVRAPDAWNLVGGVQNAGAGIKIGIIDTGIDQTHPAFQDPSLPMPPGFPKGNLPFTNNKVIVARSYVAMDPIPDDASPRDRVGHGTAAAMIAAGEPNSGPLATITGVAPKAYLGNYKVFGSPGVNDSAPDAAVVQALEEALSDGMDIVALELGYPALSGPLDRCTVAGRDQRCDLLADAVENAVRMGMTVVASAGNDGDAGLKVPTLSSINTPGTAPSAITVGASTNSHIFFSTVSLSGGDTNLQRIHALFGDGPKPNPALTAPFRDVTQLRDDGFACSPLASGALTGAIALIQRGNCGFSVKVDNAQNAGAVGVVLYQGSGQDSIFKPEGLGDTGIPAVLIGNSDGVALKTFLQSHGDAPVTLDPSLAPADHAFDTVPDLSSRGPSIADVSTGQAAIKPELVAVGTDIYTATQSYDPNGDLYDPSGYTAAQGTSFAAPMVAGAVAVVKQRNQGFSPAQLKSAVVNTAADEVNDSQGRAPVTAVGAGKLNVGAAVQPGATIEPSTLSFGILGAANFPRTIPLRVTNTSAGAGSFTVGVAPRETDPNANVTVTPDVLQLLAGQSATVNVTVGGRLPAPGSYSGAVTIQAGSLSLRAPYLYLAGDGVAANIFPVLNDGFAGLVRESGWTLAFKLVDRYGVPVQNAPVRFRAVKGGGTINSADARTDVLGLGAASVTLGPNAGEQQFSADAGGLTVDFFGYARLQPAIDAGGVVNAASFQVGLGLAPGSYITVRGRALSDAAQVASTPYLPLSLAGVSVSFDAPGKSLPGRLYYVSSSQLNVQIPWEYQGLSSVNMKVTIDEESSAVYAVPLSDHSPAIFQNGDLAAALDQNSRLVTAANPAVRGQVLQIYANGLGPVDNTPATGEVTPASPLARTLATPVVRIGGVAAEVSFSGLAPFNVGLYQLNVRVPAEVSPGIQPIVITANGIDSKPANLPVQ